MPIYPTSNSLFDSRNLKLFSIFVIFIFLLLGGTSPSMSAKNQNTDKDSGVLRAPLSKALNVHRMKQGRFIDNAALIEFYAQRDNKLLWVGDGGLNSQGYELSRVLNYSWTHGLNPANYHVERVKKLQEAKSRSSKIKLELFLTDALVRYGRDLSGLRIDGTKIKLNPEHWKALMEPRDVFSVLSKQSNLKDMLGSVEPQDKTYKALRDDLVKLSKEDVGAHEQHLPVSFGGLMKPGWGHKGILGLRARLGVDRPIKGAYTYDEKLVKAVMVFQEENGLNADGVIGEKTLQLLNRTRHDKMLQLVANMERMRWTKKDVDGRYVLVNIPSATLWAYDSKSLVFDMPVIVGSPWRRTRSFKTEIRGVRLNPTWTIPATIKRYDILPEIKANKDYLVEKEITLLRGYGSEAKRVNPSSVNWEKLPLKDLHDIRMVMAPGENNPMGRVRILMPNDYNMYLHDTNYPELFEKADRTLSSGCIRMKRPEQMAEFVMNGQSDWSKARMNEIFDDGKKTNLRIKNRIPVTVLYHTAWLGNEGKVVYGADVYNYDPKLLSLLEEAEAYALPGFPASGKPQEDTKQRVAALQYN